MEKIAKRLTRWVCSGFEVSYHGSPNDAAYHCPELTRELARLLAWEHTLLADAIRTETEISERLD